MNREPAWSTALNQLMGRRMFDQNTNDAWLGYLITRLPEKERLAVVKAMKRGDSPRQYMERVEAAKGGGK